MNSWREEERRLHAVCLAFLRGEIPSLEDCSDQDRQRLGYLAEIVALLFEPAHASELLGFADACRRSIRIWQAVPLIPGDRSRRTLDEFALSWHLGTSLDLARLRSELRTFPDSEITALSEAGSERPARPR